MRAWLRHHRHALIAALVRFGRTSGALSVVVIGIALALPAGGYALLHALSGLAQRSSLEAQISVFMKPEARREDASPLGAALRRDARVREARFVPREQALEQLKSMEGLAELAAALERNPLPDAYVVTARDPATVETLAHDLRRLPGVGSVQADAVWAHRLALLARIAWLIVWLVAGLLALGLAAVTFNTIRLQILTRREEIEVSKLLGATDAFIRRPYYYLGALQGVVGGALALAAVAAGIALLNHEVGALARSYGSSFVIPYLSVTEGAALVVCAGVLGWLGAHLSVGRHLRDIEPR
jgi:cell division transport system permease protein